MDGPRPRLSRRRVLGAAAAVLVASGGSLWWWRRASDPFAGHFYRPVTISAETRCPVCGMYPARFPRWKAQIATLDGGHLSYDSILDLLRDLGRHVRDGRPIGVGAIYVSDFGALDAPPGTPRPWVDANTAHFVIGADLNGPMGEPGFPAFANQADAKTLAAKKGGRVGNYQELYAATLRLVEKA